MKTFELQIDAFDGAMGVGLAGGRAVRVANTVPGDRWRVRRVHRGRRGDIAEAVELLQPSSDRVTPACPIQSRCGACPWQATHPDAQRRHKRTALLRRLGDLVDPSRVDPVEALGLTYGYRTKSHMPVGGETGSLLTGFWAPRSHDLVEVRDCVVQAPVVEKARHAVLTALNEARVSPWNESTGEGELRSILVRAVRSQEGGSQVGVVLVVADATRHDWRALASDWVRRDVAAAVWLNVHSERTNALLGSNTEHLAGSEWLEQYWPDAGVSLFRGAVAFTQTAEQGERVLAATVARLVPETIGTLFDLYAGAGVFTAALLSRTQRAVLVEREPSGLDGAARSFAAHPALHTVAGAVEEVLPSLIETHGHPDVVVVDPPRAGLAHEVVTALAQAAPENLMYVSCQPKSLVRDLRALTDQGLRVARVSPVDMFPHTPHLETVVHLRPT